MARQSNQVHSISRLFTTLRSFFRVRIYAAVKPGKPNFYHRLFHLFCAPPPLTLLLSYFLSSLWIGGLYWNCKYAPFIRGMSRVRSSGLFVFCVRTESPVNQKSLQICLFNRLEWFRRSGVYLQQAKVAGARKRRNTVTANPVAWCRIFRAVFPLFSYLSLAIVSRHASVLPGSTYKSEWWTSFLFLRRLCGALWGVCVALCDMEKCFLEAILVDSTISYRWHL